MKLRKWTLEDMRAIAHERGGQCLSDAYKDSHQKMYWQCEKGHQWEAPAMRIRKGTWCAICAREKVRLGMEGVHRLARERGGRCLSEHYARVTDRLHWECGQGHRWEARLTNIKEGAWCQECSLQRRRKDIAEVQRLVRERGGEYLAPAYTNTKQKLHLRCSEGHEWQTSLSNLLHGSGCPQCRETQFRQKRLEAMRALAQSRGGECLSDEFSDNKTKLTWRCAQGHVWQSKPETVARGDHWCKTCSNQKKKKHTLEKMQALAKRRGGKCLSTKYVNVQSRMRWQCRKGHIWDTTAAHVLQGSWCPICGSNKHNIEEMQALAHEQGGRCLSEHYDNLTTKLLWECRQGHTWETMPVTVMHQKAWCPECHYLSLCRHEKSRKNICRMG